MAPPHTIPHKLEAYRPKMPLSALSEGLGFLTPKSAFLISEPFSDERRIPGHFQARVFDQVKLKTWVADYGGSGRRLEDEIKGKR